MSSQFKILFHRYYNGQSRISNPVFKSFDNFDAALLHANGMIQGMKAADPITEFTVASIEHFGLRGEECRGAGLFETEDEMTARLARETGK